MPYHYLSKPLLALMVFMGCFVAACVPEEDGDAHVDDPSLLTLGQEVTLYSSVTSTIKNGNFCKVNVQRFGQLDLEETYLPKVVWCENREAPEASFEALKAQAIAARTYAFYRTYDYTAPGPLDPGRGTGSQNDQSYDCGTPSGESWDRARRAVVATRGEVFINNTTGHIVWGCYASGATRNLNDPSCRATSRHYTEDDMTRNQGKAWGSAGFRQTTLGGVTPGPTKYQNHGCMGQKEANCLASAQSLDASQILRYFYGDIRLIKLDAPCFAGGTAPASTRPASSNRTPSSGAAPQECRSNSSRPSILTRQQWGARSYRGAPASLGTPRRITIHHEGASAARTSGGASNVRGIQNAHMNGNGWDDVGYHYLIMPDGQIYQGRAEYRAGQLALGAHAGGANTGNIGIMLYGNFFLQQPSQAQMASAAQLVGWLSATYNITPSVGSTLLGHRDVTSTSCPGDNLYNRLAEIETAARSEQVCSPGTGGGGSTTTPERTFLPTPDVTLPATIFVALRLDNVSDQPFRLDALEIERDGRPVLFDIIEDVAGATLEVADNTACDSPNSVFVIPAGKSVTALTSGPVKPGDIVRIKQFAGASAPAGCTLQGRVDVYGNNSSSGQGSSWHRLHMDGTQNFEFTLQGSELEIITPENHAALPQDDALFESQASDDIVRVEYFAELYPLGSSSSPAQNFRLPYSFSNEGRRIITAKGYDAAGTFVAFDQIELTVQEGSLVFDGLSESGVYPPNLGFKVRISKSAIVAAATALGVPISTLGVRCTADGFALPVSPASFAGIMWSGNQGTFTISHQFSQMGSRKIVCEITNGATVIMSTEELLITILEGASGLEFLAPKHRGWYVRDGGIEFLVRAHDPRIVRVDYVADGKWKFGDSTNVTEFFPFRYTFTHYGTRRVVAQGFSAEGMKLAEEDIYITITNQLGVVPSGSANVITQAIPDTPMLITPISPVSPSVVNPQSSPNLNNRRSLACAVLAHHDAGRLQLSSTDSRVPSDTKGTPYHNIRDTCNGGKASNSDRSHRGPVRVDLNMGVLQLLYDMPSSGFTYAINWIAGAAHSSGSQHYYGEAVDTGGILAPSFQALTNCNDSSQVGLSNRWIWNYGASNGSNQTLSRCGQVLTRPPGFNYLDHSSWSHSAWR